MNIRDIAAAFVLAVGFLLSEEQIATSQTVQPGEEGALATLLAPQPGTQICFRRVYDAAHLAAHPQQTVTEMEFRLAYYRWDPDQTHPDGQRDYYFDLIVRQRGERETLTAMGDCVPFGQNQIGCGVDCDGGGFHIAKRPDGSLFLDLTPFGRVRMTRGCGDDGDDVDLTAGKDDSNFLLEPMSPGQCPAYEDW